MTVAQTGGTCVACHVLSRDGKKMAITYDGGDGPATMVDVATSTRQDLSNKWNFGTFTPDGSEVPLGPRRHARRPQLRRPERARDDDGGGSGDASRPVAPTARSSSTCVP